MAGDLFFVPGVAVEGGHPEAVRLRITDMHSTAERLAVLGSGVAGPAVSYLVHGSPPVNTPALYDATIAHVRHGEPPLSFAHRLCLWLVDLEALPELPWPVRSFARFEGRDHFDPEWPGSIRTKLDTWLAERGVDLAGGRVWMLTCPRVLGYVFNPITVYWCHHPDDGPACVVAEVHNTYGGRHAYLLYPDADAWASVEKEFFVSPFQQAHGDYVMHLPPPDSLLSATVVLRTGDAATPELSATLRGLRRPVNRRWVRRLVLSRPFVPQRVAGLIRRHGIGLWLRGAKRPRVTDRMGNMNRTTHTWRRSSGGRSGAEGTVADG